MARPPREFCQFVGQKRVVDTLRALANEAMAKKGVLPPVMLVGPAGSGKTALAEAVARHLRGEADGANNLHVVHAGRRSLLALRETLTQANEGDVLFVDEAHALDQQDAELLYLAVDQQETLGLNGDRIDRSVHIPIAPVSIILATNLPGSVPKALRSRALQIELDDYTERELREIGTRVATSHGVELTPQAAKLLAQHSTGTPRSVEHLVRLVASLGGPSRATKAHIARTLKKGLGHDQHGLRPIQRRLLEHLAATPDGTARAEQVAAILGLDASYVRAEVEDSLVRRGLLRISRSDRRRQLTERGQELATALRSGRNRR